MCGHPAFLIPTTTLPLCRCGEPLDHEDEISHGMCWDCMAEEAGFQMPEPEIQELKTMAQLDRELGIVHRRAS